MKTITVKKYVLREDGRIEVRGGVLLCLDPEEWAAYADEFKKLGFREFSDKDFRRLEANLVS